MDRVRIACIGLGGRGYGLMCGCLLNMPDVDIVAVCDSYTDRAEAGRDAVKSKRGTTPVCSTDYTEVIGLPEVDVVMVTTAWEDHIRIAIDAMRLGKFVAMEVGGAYRLEDCHELVRAYRETGSHCMMLENCCYGEYELMVLEMVKKGMFGEIVHAEGGYCHDLRGEISDGEKNRHYRLRNYIARNCENYPTHELGPIAKVLHINDGNRITHMTSYDSKSRGLREFVETKRKNNEKLQQTVFNQGDVITTVMKCENGETITIYLDTTLPRTYSRHFTIRGTKAAYFEDNNSVFIDGRHNIFDFMPKKMWNNAKKYAKTQGHPLWNRKNRKYRRLGHGGMDWFVLRAMVETVRAGAYPPIDVYDTALWMSITALSEQSIKAGNKTVEVPDFTDGAYRDRSADTSRILPDYTLHY